MPDPKKTPAGSPVKSEPVFLAIGHLRSAHGLRGEITMEVWTDFPERIKPGSRLFLGEDHTEITVTAIRSKDRLLLLTLQGYDERDIVNSLRNQIVYTQTKNLPKLPQGQYYHHELVGLQVIDENGEDIGVIKAILETGANDVFVIDNQGKEILIPFIKSVILSIDQSAGFVKVKLPRWS